MKDVKHANMKPQTVLNIKMDILSEEEVRLIINNHINFNKFF